VEAAVEFARKGQVKYTATAGLLSLPRLCGALWSNDDAGVRLLDELRSPPS